MEVAITIIPEELERLKKDLGREVCDGLMQWVDKILDYNIPLYVIKTRNETPAILEKMANIFIMVNRSGQRITNPELLLSYTAGILDQELASLIRSFLRRVPAQLRRGGEHNIISEVRVLNTSTKPQAEGNRQRKAFRAAVDKFSTQIDIHGRKVLYENILAAGRSYRLALSLLSKVFGEAALDLLPSHLSLVPVAAYLYKSRINGLESLSERDFNMIKKWILLVNFNGYYTAKAATRLQKDMETLKR